MMLRNFFKTILKILAKRVIRRYKPIVVGVTGSVGKTGAKDAMYEVLKSKYKVWRSHKNYNDEFGVPMTILDITPLESPGWRWRLRMIDQLIAALWLAYGWPWRGYPQVLVLEMGADKPGDIAYLTDIAPPTVSVVMAVGTVPVHVEYYASPQAVAKEKAVILKDLPVSGGLAALNYDDKIVLEMNQNTKAVVKTFGFSDQADVWVSEVAYFIADSGGHVGGLSFKIHKGDAFIPVRINDMIAPHQIYGVLAATLVGLHLNVNLVDMASSFERMQFPKGRMKLIRGKHNTVVIDDSYNAAPLSTHAALDSLEKFTKALRKVTHKRHRKIAILGEMAELGKYTESAHRTIGQLAGDVADVVIGVGNASLFIVEQAREKLGDKRVLHFDTSHDAALAIKDMIKEKDIILIKGSQSQRMEHVVQAVMAEPEKAQQLLVRQTGRWK